MSVGYYDTDAARTLTQGASSTTYELDPVGRRSSSTTSGGGSPSTTVRFYGDEGDNPAWATTTTGGVSTTTRYVGGPAGGLALEVTASAGAVVVADGHGTVATTIPVPVSGDASTTTGWHRADEFGNPLSSTPSTGVLSYAWHGKDERAVDASTALVLMGVRLYNAVTGLFTSRDPIPGGNTTTYTYPQDPINTHDLDGKAGINWRQIGRWGAIAGGIVGAVACGASIICGALVGAAAGAAAYTAVNAGTNRWSIGGLALSTGLGALGGSGYGTVGRAFGHAGKNARMLGVTFSRYASARGTDFYWRGTRVFGLHSHRIRGEPAWKFLHYHRRSPIKSHRPWEKGW